MTEEQGKTEKATEKVVIHVILAGDVEETFVAGVSSTKEKAEKAIKDWAIDNGSVEEFVLDALSNVDPDYHVFSIMMCKDGTITFMKDVARDIEFAGRRGDVHFWGPFPGSTYFSSRIPAKSVEEAVAIANEYRLKTIADGKWDSVAGLFEPKWPLIHPKKKEAQKDEGQGAS